MASKEPLAQRARHFVEVSLEKMIGSRNEDNSSRLVGFRIKRLDEPFEMRSCAVLIAFSLHK
jgi:hypothetical protein